MKVSVFGLGRYSFFTEDFIGAVGEVKDEYLLQTVNTGLLSGC